MRQVSKGLVYGSGRRIAAACAGSTPSPPASGGEGRGEGGARGEGDQPLDPASLSPLTPNPSPPQSRGRGGPSPSRRAGRRGRLPPMRTLLFLLLAPPLLAADPPATVTNSIGMNLERIAPGEFVMG